VTPRGRTAFTLVELIICVGLIALLAALIMPAAARARATARNGACAVNLHQLQQLIVQYGAEYHDLPYYAAPWPDGRVTELDAPLKTWTCPADPLRRERPGTSISAYSYTASMYMDSNQGACYRPWNAYRNYERGCGQPMMLFEDFVASHGWYNWISYDGRLATLPRTGQ
jgi:type II secretory pathway pseudopilin PulG